MPQLTTRLDISKIRAMRERLFGPTVEDVQGPNENPSPLRDEEQGRPRNVSTSRHDRKRRHIHETSPIHANGHEQQQGLSGRNVQKKEPRCPRERSSPLREELSEHQDRETIRCTSIAYYYFELLLITDTTRSIMFQSPSLPQPGATNSASSL